MKHSYISLLFACLFITSISHAQLTKGTKTMDFDGNLFTSFSRYKDANYFSKRNTFQLNANGTLGYFLNKNWLLGGGVGLGLSRTYNNVDNLLGTMNDKISRNIKIDYSVRSIIRYYVKNVDKQGIFVFANTQFSGYNDILKPGLFPGTSRSIAYDTYFNWSTGIGMHKMLNEQIAAEAILYYSDNKLVSLNVYTRNFFRTLDKKNAEAPPQYIAQNRWLADGSMSVNYATNTGKLNASAGIYVGKMLTDRWMLGSGFSFNIGSTFASISVAPFVRYYIPISNRLFVFPFIGSSMNYSKQGKNKFASISFDRGIGYNYFLTRSMALSGTINANLNLSKSADDNAENKRTSGNMTINAGLNYFF